MAVAWSALRRRQAPRASDRHVGPWYGSTRQWSLGARRSFRFEAARLAERARRRAHLRLTHDMQFGAEYRSFDLVQRGRRITYWLPGDQVIFPPPLPSRYVTVPRRRTTGKKIAGGRETRPTRCTRMDEDGACCSWARSGGVDASVVVVVYARAHQRARPRRTSRPAATKTRKVLLRSRLAPHAEKHPGRRATSKDGLPAVELPRAAYHFAGTLHLPGYRTSTGSVTPRVTFHPTKHIRGATRFAATATNFTVPIRYPTIISRMATAPRAVLIPVRISPRKDRQRSALRKTAGQNGAMFRVQSSTTIFDEAKPGCLPNKDR